MRPPRTSSRARSHCGWKRTMNASAISTRSAAARSAVASCAVSAIGFSHSTCLPAAAALSVQRHVQVIRQRVVDRLDLRIREQRLVRTVGRRNAQRVRGRARARFVARRDGADLEQRALPHPRQHALAADLRRAQHTPDHLASSLSVGRFVRVRRSRAGWCRAGRGLLRRAALVRPEFLRARDDLRVVRKLETHARIVARRRTRVGDRRRCRRLGAGAFVVTVPNVPVIGPDCA